SAYSFAYSQRPGTPAAALQGQIHDSVKTFRLHSLQNLLRSQQEDFNKSFTERVVPILFERAGNKQGQIMGRSPHMQSTYVDAPERLIGQIIDVHATGGYSGSLAGDVVLS